jgi:hypothetical protein
MKLKKGDMVEITWVDCFGSGAWEDFEPIPEPPKIHSIGYFLKRAHKGIYLASGLPGSLMDGKVLAPTWIPDGTIFKIRKLK